MLGFWPLGFYLAIKNQYNTPIKKRKRTVILYSSPAASLANKYRSHNQDHI